MVLEKFVEVKYKITCLRKFELFSLQKDERNFHIFYQLCEAADSSLKNKLCLGGKNAKDFNILQSCVKVSTINDDEDFKEVQHAFEELDFKNTDSEVLGLYTIVAAILNLGNVEFVEGKPDESVVKDSTKEYVKAAAKLLRVDEDIVNNSLITRTIHIMGSQGGDTICAQTPDASDYARDALCKFIYGKMFDWLVRRLNESMGARSIPSTLVYWIFLGLKYSSITALNSCVSISQTKCCSSISTTTLSSLRRTFTTRKVFSGAQLTSSIMNQ